jgi:hypothetical protein
MESGRYVPLVELLSPAEGRGRADESSTSDMKNPRSDHGPIWRLGVERSSFQRMASGSRHTNGQCKCNPTLVGIEIVCAGNLSCNCLLRLPDVYHIGRSRSTTGMMLSQPSMAFPATGPALPRAQSEAGHMVDQFVNGPDI